MKILLLGAAGCFGSSFERVCAAETGIELVCPSRKDLEVTDAEGLLHFVRSHRPDVVLNSVAIVDLNYCEAHPNEAFAVHATPAMHLAKLCEELGIVCAQTSTHAVFDGTASEPYTEDDRPNPRNVYALTKWASEQLVSTLCSRHYVFRFPTMFGPRRNQSLGFVDKVVGWLREGRELRIADDKIDSPTYSMDAARMVLAVLRNRDPFGVYHVANAGIVSYFDFVLCLREMLGHDDKVISAKDGDFQSIALKSRYTALRSKRLEPMRTWRDALAAYVESDLRPAS